MYQCTNKHQGKNNVVAFVLLQTQMALYTVPSMALM